MKNRKKFRHLPKQAALRSIGRAPIYMFGVQVPRTSHEAGSLDTMNGNAKWQDAEKCELDQLNEYGTFEDKGKGVKPPDGHQRINVHFVYAVKHDLGHKARLVTGGHMTELPKDSVYSGDPCTWHFLLVKSMDSKPWLVTLEMPTLKTTQKKRSNP